MDPETRTGRLAQHFRTRAADVRSQLLQRHGLPDDAPLAAAFVAPLRSCCPPQEGMREIAREEAESSARQRHPPAARQPQPVQAPAAPVAPVVDASLGTPVRGVAGTGHRPAFPDQIACALRHHHPDSPPPGVTSRRASPSASRLQGSRGSQGPRLALLLWAHPSQSPPSPCCAWPPPWLDTHTRCQRRRASRR